MEGCPGCIQTATPGPTCTGRCWMPNKKTMDYLQIVKGLAKDALMYPEGHEAPDHPRLDWRETRLREIVDVCENAGQTPL